MQAFSVRATSSFSIFLSQFWAGQLPLVALKFFPPRLSTIFRGIVQGRRARRWRRRRGVVTTTELGQLHCKAASVTATALAKLHSTLVIYVIQLPISKRDEAHEMYLQNVSQSANTQMQRNSICASLSHSLFLSLSINLYSSSVINILSYDYYDCNLVDTM